MYKYTYMKHTVNKYAGPHFKESVQFHIHTRNHQQLLFFPLAVAHL